MQNKRKSLHEILSKTLDKSKLDYKLKKEQQSNVAITPFKKSLIGKELLVLKSKIQTVIKITTNIVNGSSLPTLIKFLQKRDSSKYSLNFLVEVSITELTIFPKLTSSTLNACFEFQELVKKTNLDPKYKL